jgi:catechol 2,3-dioxygenase-like lactoylglutathione lyase family enzyme
MIDHTGISVSNFEKSKKFYTEALKPIGYKLLLEFPVSITGTTNVAGFGEPPKTDFWIGEGTPNDPRVHIAFRVSNRSLVDAFHQAALAAGGKDHGAPGLRPQYHSNYYGAFVLDPDGHNIEVVCHEPAG